MHHIFVNGYAVVGAAIIGVFASKTGHPAIDRVIEILSAAYILFCFGWKVWRFIKEIREEKNGDSRKQ